MNRREILVAGAAAIGLFFGFRRRPASGAPLLRPPGALPPGAFERECIRCFRCAEVCPPKAIVFESLGAPRDSDTPFIRAEHRACILCMKCTEVCPTSALKPIAADLAVVKTSVRMGAPQLDRDKCWPWNGKAVCRICYLACPYPNFAIQLNGPRQAPVFQPNDCVGCGLCEESCPADARAIHIVPFGHEVKA